MKLVMVLLVIVHLVFVGEFIETAVSDILPPVRSIFLAEKKLGNIVIQLFGVIVQDGLGHTVPRLVGSFLARKNIGFQQAAVAMPCAGEVE